MASTTVLQAIDVNNPPLKPTYEKLSVRAKEPVIAALRVGKNANGQQVTIIADRYTFPITFTAHSPEMGYSLEETHVLGAGDTLTFSYHAASGLWVLAHVN